MGSLTLPGNVIRAKKIGAVACPDKNPSNQLERREIDSSQTASNYFALFRVIRTLRLNEPRQPV